MGTPMTDDAVKTLRKYVKRAAWDMAYAEHMRLLDRRRLSFIKEVLRRGGFPTDIPASGDDDESDEDTCLTVEEFAAWMISDAKTSIEFHENNIPRYTAKFACARIMLDQIDCGLDVEDILREVRAEMEEKWPLLGAGTGS